jgi:hypothetical protein
MKKLYVLFLILFSSSLFPQTPLEKEELMRPTLSLSIFDQKNSTVKTDSIGFGDLPKEIEYRGIIVEAVKWADALGDNVLILTQTGAYTLKDPIEMKAQSEVGAYLFTKSKTDKKYTRQWKLYDFVDCFGVDMYAGFYQRRLTITDLDKDGTAEATFIYKTSCRGDISPGTQKLVMYEKNEKYALRGETLIQGGDPKKNSFNNFKADDKFKSQPVFLEFAKKRWATIGFDDYKQFRSK